MASEMVTIPAEAVPDLRRMLAIGMSALGEVERIRDNMDVVQFKDERYRELVAPIHPTGANELGSFATAMRWLDHAHPVEG